jgi:hypothetical protein
MVNLFDFLAPKAADPFADFASRFGISQDQATRAMAAMMPAFAMAMQRRAPTPADFVAMFDPSAQSRQDPLQLFFGSRELAERVADQTAAFAGLSSSIMHRMMPAVAAALATSLGKAADETTLGKFYPSAARRARDERTARAAEESGEALGGMISAMLGISRGKPEPEPEPEPEKSAVDRNMEALAEIMHTGREAQEEHLRNLQDIFSKMMGGR